MNIKLNGKTYDTQNARTVDALLEELEDFQKEGVAVAVDETVVPKKQWQEFELKEGHSVEIIKAVQGG